MDRLTMYYIVCGIWIVLGVWAIVEAVQLKIHWIYKILLVLLSMVLAPVAFALTMWIKWRLNKKDPDKKNKPGGKKS
jgi:hypothetical protein